MVEKKGAKIREAFENLIKMPGHESYIRMERMSSSKYMVDKNYLELIRFFDDFEGVFDLARYQTQFRADNNEVKRLLHNYSASVFSFLAHMKGISTENDTFHDFGKVYFPLLDEYESHDIRQFIIRLRVYLQHIDLINPETQYHFDIQDSVITQTTIKIELSRDELLKWDDWKAQGKRFLETSPEKLYLKKIIVQHKKLLDKLFTNTIQGITTEYKGPIEEYIQRNMEFVRLRDS